MVTKEILVYSQGQARKHEDGKETGIGATPWREMTVVLKPELEVEGQPCTEPFLDVTTAVGCKWLP